MKVIIPNRLPDVPTLTPSQIEAIQAVQAAFTQISDAVESGIPEPKTALMRLIDGYKSYIVMFLAIAGAILGMWLQPQVVTIPIGIASILAALGYGANRSATEKQTTAVKVQTEVLKTQTAQIVNSVIIPDSPVAAQTAAAVAPPPDTIVPVKLKYALAPENIIDPPAPPPPATMDFGGRTYKLVVPKTSRKVAK